MWGPLWWVYREQRMDKGNRKVDFFRGEILASPLVLVNDYAGQGDEIKKAVASLSGHDFHLLVVSNLDWNNDLTPWPADHLGRGLAPMKGEGPDYLRFLEKELIPETMRETGISPAAFFVAGYSLAGLFAIYAALSGTLFSKAASVSGSLWYPGFEEWVEESEASSRLSHVYLSYGDKEPNSRNELLRSVGTKTEAIRDALRGKGIRTDFEVNPGNHFQDGTGRLAKGIAKLLETI